MDDKEKIAEITFDPPVTLKPGESLGINFEVPITPTSEVFYGIAHKGIVQQRQRHNAWPRRLRRWLGRMWRKAGARAVQREEGDDG